ncbi:MAG: ClbS/DfsB family four-helix bundle protein [Anaerolineales bacterium]|nr:ClbS/DfsB family four-helix bundle protein [Anaerolineales bacterium]
MEDRSRRSMLLDLITRAHLMQMGFWDALSDAEQTARGTPDQWAPKDIMAHINVWNERMVSSLEAAARNETPEESADFEHDNQEIFAANKDRSWEDLLVFEEEVFTRLARAVEALADEDLDDPKRFEWTREQPLWWRVVSTPYYHGFWHLADILLVRGDVEGAQAIHEHIAQVLEPLDDSDVWIGRIRYNLACHYALHDQSVRAIELLEDAFQLNPSLVAWSKQDSDLDALRDMQEFEALYPD